MEEIEQELDCPFCGETITMLLDLSAGEQSYVEDCEVCCRPILIHFRGRGDRLESFSAEAAS